MASESTGQSPSEDVTTDVPQLGRDVTMGPAQGEFGVESNKHSRILNPPGPLVSKFLLLALGCFTAPDPWFHIEIQRLWAEKRHLVPVNPAMHFFAESDDELTLKEATQVAKELKYCFPKMVCIKAASIMILKAGLLETGKNIGYSKVPWFLQQGCWEVAGWKYTDAATNQKTREQLIEWMLAFMERHFKGQELSISRSLTTFADLVLPLLEKFREREDSTVDRTEGMVEESQNNPSTTTQSGALATSTVVSNMVIALAEVVSNDGWKMFLFEELEKHSAQSD